MNEQIIKYGISPNYVSFWNFEEAYREILQNFLDFKNYEVEITDEEVLISNDYCPDNFEFLKIGFTSKTGQNLRGKHGEGLKIAMLVLKRLNIKNYLKFKNKIIEPVIYHDEHLGECFGLKISLSEDVSDKFTFSFEKFDGFEEEYSNFLIKKEDIIFTNNFGDIVNREIGSIYVGELFVTKLEDLSHAYNLRPEFVEMGRDRTIPKTLDIEYYTSKINGDYIKSQNLTFEDVNVDNRDINYIETISTKMAESVIPEYNEEGKIELFSNGKEISKYNLYNCLISHKIIKEKIEKIKFTLKEKDCPHLVIKNFNFKFDDEFSVNAKEELDKIQYESLNWKYE